MKINTKKEAIEAYRKLVGDQISSDKEIYSELCKACSLAVKMYLENNKEPKSAND